MERKNWTILVASHLAVGITGYALAPREMLDTEVKHEGWFTKDTKRVLSATVTSLKAENRLLVYSYKGDARVKVERAEFFGLLGGSQELIVPAGVTYYLNLANLTLENVSFDEKSKIVTVKLPPVEMGDVAFQPERATTINGGLLTFNQAQVDELSKLAYATARKAFVKQAQGAALVDLARSQAKLNIPSYFEIPLRIAGQPDVRVVATFK